MECYNETKIFSANFHPKESCEEVDAISQSSQRNHLTENYAKYHEVGHRPCLEQKQNICEDGWGILLQQRALFHTRFLQRILKNVSIIRIDQPRSGWFAIIIRLCASLIRFALAVAGSPRIIAASLLVIFGSNPPRWYLSNWNGESTNKQPCVINIKDERKGTTEFFEKRKRSSKKDKVEELGCWRNVNLILNIFCASCNP